MKLRLLFSLVPCITGALAQKAAIGEWRVHLPYNHAITVTEGLGKIYCANKTGMFYYDMRDKSIHRFSKANGLSETKISTINYYGALGVLVIAYENSSIDLVNNYGEVYNIPDIKRKNIPGAKNINRISFAGNNAYLSCGFGIVEIDLIKYEIRDTWYIGPNGSSIEVFDVASNGKSFFAATQSGLYQSKEGSDNLSNFSSWFKHSLKPSTKFTNLAWLDERMFASTTSGYDLDTVFLYDGNKWDYLQKFSSFGVTSLTVTNTHKLLLTNRFSVEEYDTSRQRTNLIYGYYKDPSAAKAILDEEGNMWIADQNGGLFKYSDGKFGNLVPNGPFSPDVVALSASGNELWAAGGKIDDIWNNVYSMNGFYSFIDETWTSYNNSNTTALDSIIDFMSIIAIPNEHRRAYAGSWNNGLVEIVGTSNDSVIVYSQSNSSLSANSIGRVRVGGMAYDKDGNLWMSNSDSERPLSVKRVNGSWQSFSLPGVNGVTTSQTIVDSYNQKWIVLPRGRGLAVFNENSSSTSADDSTRVLDMNAGRGKLPSTEVYAVAEDHEGQVWVGTAAGVVVFYSPGEVFSGNNFDSEFIFIEQDGHTEHLLETQVVTAIAIDGADRKWFGTKNSGVFLMSADGTKEIYHFSEENSPMLSNSISSIAIMPETGEVFFATDRGIISFMGDATEGKKEYENVKVFPNPVRPYYEGLIAIRGLVDRANVKISDVSGGLVYETFANGGQATWNGRNFSGEKVQSGVYFIYVSNSDGSKTHVSKLLIMN